MNRPVVSAATHAAARTPARTRGRCRTSSTGISPLRVRFGQRVVDERAELLVAEARHRPAVDEELRRLVDVERLGIGDVLLDDARDLGSVHVMPDALEVE